MPEQRLLTYEDLFEFPDDGLRRELLDGELIVSPSPKSRHQEIVRRLIVTISIHLDQVGGGRVFLAPLDVVFEPRTVLEPDVFFIADERLDILTEANVQGVPSLTVEVLSNPRMDKVRKRDAYARYGVPEYWVVDPDADRAEVYRLSTDGYGKPMIFEIGETLTTPLIPGLEIDLEQLFRR